MQYVCRLGTPDGRVLTQIEKGSDEDSLRRSLERQGFHIFELRQRGLKISLPFFGKGRRKKLKIQEFLLFNTELAALLRAGLPLLQALELMLESMENEDFKSVLSEIYENVKSGAELSDAFGEHGDMFPSLYAPTLKAGERSGELEQVVRRFVRYLRLVLDARKRVVSALVYPLVLIGLSIAMLVLMAIFVVPNFSRFYADLGAELPTITKVTLGISFFIRDYFFFLAGGLFLASWAFRRWRATPSGLLVVDRWRLRLPILGTIFHYFSLAEFCRSLATLLTGGIPLVSAMETAVSSVSNAYISAQLGPPIDEVREGQAFHETLRRTEEFPNLAIDMIKVGEATGALDDMLTAVADYFDEQVEVRMQRLLSLVEPFMLIVMGCIIAVLLISIYLPMFSALSSVGG